MIKRTEHIGKRSTAEYRLALKNEGPLGGQWLDKPHRLVYDLCNEIDRLQAENQRLREALEGRGNG